ncbi:hypothetical protein MTP99_002893 [Tenebrio molitor]|jgi:hypothetical protein|nr:hypothetical protein MTP99_002893 [Tenebrio molitor]
MGEYEKEMRRLQSLWDAVQTNDEEIIESDADGGSEVDNVSINSDYPDVEQVANDFEERENDPVEDRGAAVSIDINEEENRTSEMGLRIFKNTTCTI